MDDGTDAVTKVLYAFPLYPSAVPRLAAISTVLGPGALSVMIDNPEQVALLDALTSQSGGQVKPHVFLKIDVAYHRAGVIPGSPTYRALLPAVLAAERDGHCVLHGLYAHAGQSYYTRQDWAALAYLTAEYETLHGAARDVRDLSPGHPLVLSVGATPTATALQHPDLSAVEGDPGTTTTTPPAAAGGDDTEQQPAQARVATLSTLLSTLRAAGGLHLEVHAGVYPTLDLQQLATHARDAALLSSADIAISVLAEVASLYPGRGGGSTAGNKNTNEALLNAGSLALGREPCKEDGAGHYAAWGLVMPWGSAELEATAPAPAGFPAAHGGWQVGRISQEHGVLTWAGPKGEGEAEAGTAAPLRFGQRVRVWPNHACIAGAGYGHYLVVDSRRKGKEDEVVDVWERWNGW